MTAALYEVGISWTRSTALQSVGIEAGQTIAGGDVQGLCFCPKGGKIFIIPLILTWLAPFQQFGRWRDALAYARLYICRS